MGDNSTAPFVLGAVLLALWRAEHSRDSIWRLLACGACIGLAVGLKLTNAFYAIALGVALLAGDGTWLARIARLAVVTLSALAIFALLTGQWFHHMWATFGNPLLPQFNAWFESPLASNTMVADTRWLPKTSVEWLTWPLQMMVHPKRVGEVGLRQLAWAVLYVLMGCWAIKSLRARRPSTVCAAHSVRERQLLTFVAMSFLLWMAAFSIHRYLAAAEMLVPIAIWLVSHRILSTDRASRFATLAVAACVLVAVTGWSHWGRARLAQTAFQAQMPETTSQPATVLMTGLAPQGWMIPLMPAQYRFVGLSGFPEGPGYAPRAREIWGATPQRIFALLPATDDARQRRVDRLNRVTDQLGLNETCGRLAWWAAKLKLETRPQARAAESAGSKCALTLPVSRRIDTAAEDRRLREQAVPVLARHGLELLDASCLRKQASIGEDLQPYQWCRVIETGQ